jgi:hypothetical protein
MNSVDHSVLNTLREWQAGGLTLWLMTVAETLVSSPRQPGAILAHLIAVRNQSAETASPVPSVNQAQPNNQEVCS